MKVDLRAYSKALLFVTVLLFLTLAYRPAQADVLVEDARAAIEIAPGSGSIESGSGNPGDYVILACGIFDTPIDVSFTDPTPGDWSIIDIGDCDDPNGCLSGIWGRFTQNAGSEEIACNWQNPDEVIFTAGTFRYGNVDPTDPIIDVDCNTGSSELQSTTAVAPSIDTLAGSQVVRVFTYFTFSRNEIEAIAEVEDNTSASFKSLANVIGFTLTMDGNTELFLSDGPTGEEELEIEIGETAFWRACTLALRMAPVRTPIPTLSEWGLIAMAGLIGIAGFLAVRRKAAA